MRTFSAVALAVALLVLVGGCRSMTGRSAGQVMDNKMTLASVKTKLAAEQIQNLTWVNVDTNEGVVYLTGNAKTPEAKAHATEIAQRVDGVERVVNDIHVTGTEQARSPAAPTSAAAASPASTGAAGSVVGEVVAVDQGSGTVTLRAADQSNVELRLPPSSLKNVRPGDRVTVSVSPLAR